MNQVEVCNLRKNLQKLIINANNIISFVSKALNFNNKKSYLNLLQLAY